MINMKIQQGADLKLREPRGQFTPPNFWAVWEVPPNPVSPNTAVGTFSIFVVISVKRPKGEKISDLRPARKLDLGALVFFIMNDTLKLQV